MLSRTRSLVCPKVCVVSYMNILKYALHNESSVSEIEDLSHELLAAMHGRKSKERKDSVTIQILKERIAHQQRINSINDDKRLFEFLQAMGLGSKRKRHQVYTEMHGHRLDSSGKKSVTGAGYSILLRVLSLT